MKVTIENDGTTVSWIRNGERRVLKHRTEAQAGGARRAIRECHRRKDMTLHEFIDLWDECHLRLRCSKRTIKTSLSLVKNHILPDLGMHVTSAIDTDVVLAFIHKRADELGSFRSVSPAVQRLQAILNKAVRWGLIDGNPVLDIDGLFLGKKPKGLDPDE